MQMNVVNLSKREATKIDRQLCRWLYLLSPWRRSMSANWGHQISAWWMAPLRWMDDARGGSGHESMDVVLHLKSSILQRKRERDERQETLLDPLLMRRVSQAVRDLSEVSIQSPEGVKDVEPCEEAFARGKQVKRVHREEDVVEREREKERKRDRQMREDEERCDQCDESGWAVDEKSSLT